MPFNRDEALAFIDNITSRISGADSTVFKSQVFRRLEAGAAEYGDASFSGPVGDTLKEMEEEFLDIAGWGFVGWCKLQRFRRWLTAPQSSSSDLRMKDSTPSD